MPHTPQIDIRALQKKGELKESVFFNLLGMECRYSSPETVRSFYMGLVRHITKELREKGVVRLPHLGDLALVKQKPKLGWAGKFQTILSARYLLKFYPKDSWRQYFMKIAERPGREGALDPREKILNRKL